LYIQVGSDGRELYGNSNDEYTYWTGLVTGSPKSAADPYGYVDGGAKQIGNYQTTVSPVYKSQALTMHLMPELKEVWIDQVFLNYADRFEHFGYWERPDPCAPPKGVCIGGSMLEMFAVVRKE